MHKHIFFLILSFFSLPVLASEKAEPLTTEQILALSHGEYQTPCASEKFANALYDHEDEIYDDDDEETVRRWAQNIMQSPEVLKQVLNCPEIKSITDDMKTIKFSPVVFKFSDDDDARTITINYSTQKQILKQRLILSTKRSLPNGDPNPKLMDFNDPAKYINTDPAWYAIMVVQHDSLSDFVGPDKNNTLSLKYLEEHIDDIYPRGYHCTSKSAITIGNNQDTINKVVHEVVDLEKDSNDYYVAGDVNLEWVMYAEIAAEVVLTVATAGAGEGAMIGLKSLRAGKTGMRLAKNMGKFKKSVHVQKYVQTSNKILKNAETVEKMERNLKRAEKYEKVIGKANKARAAGNIKEAEKYEKQAEKIYKNAKKIDPDITKDTLKNADGIKDNIKNLKKESKELSKSLEDTLKENKKLLKEKRDALKTARENADPVSVKDYDNKFNELQKLYDKRKNPAKLKNAKDIEKNEQITKRIEELEKNLKDYEGASTLGDYAKLRREINELESVDKYMDAEKQLKTILEYRKSLKSLKTRPQTGNVITKGIARIKNVGKTIKAANSGAKMMNKAGRVARAGMSSRSAKIGDWLFDATLKHGAQIARFERDAGLIYGAITFLGEMYDQTSSTNQEYTNGIEFKPLCLLSADDLKGQENVVNYGMWLLWQGNSTDPSDDDAAYLQAMDFASKFFYQLDEFQDEHGAQCNVDIFVVRPIIRLDETNPDDTKGELFYLFMNEIPWSTAEQFGEQISDIADWERIQKQLTETDPDGKYKQPDEDSEIDSEIDTESKSENQI